MTACWDEFRTLRTVLVILLFTVVLVVDLDGTYLKNDFFAEQFYKKLIENPFFVAYHLASGGILKVKNVLLDKLDIQYPLSQLINSEVEKFIRTKRKEYDQVVIVSATPDFFVKRILADDKNFDAVYGSTSLNLKGEQKLEFIRQTFGEDFHYIGNSKADIPLLKAAKKGYYVRRNRIDEYN